MRVQQLKGPPKQRFGVRDLTLPLVLGACRSRASADLNRNSCSSFPVGIHSPAAAVVPREHGLLLLHDGQVLPRHG